MPRRLTLIGVGVITGAALFWALRPTVEKSESPSRPELSTLPRAPSAAPFASVPSFEVEGAANLARQAMVAELQRTLQTRRARPNEAVLTFASDDAYRRFLTRASAAGLTILGQIDGLRTVRLRTDSLSPLAEDLIRHATDYSNVGPNYLLQPPESQTPPPKEDRAAVREIPLGNNSLAFLGATGDRSQWGFGTTIAILDSGVTGDSTFGTGRLRALDVGLGLAPGRGAGDGHGTAVAGLAAGLAADAPGVAPAAHLLSLRVTDAAGTSDLFTVAQAIVAAVDAGAQILNLSLGGYGTGPALTSAIDYATARGAVLVAAAGNNQAAQLIWPAADPRVISVGAVDALGQQVTFSNSGEQLQVSAPGFGVQTAWLDGKRVTVNGTSASAPFVAGAIAAVMSQNPRLTATQAWEVLAATVSEAGAPGPDADYGRGILNVGWAMNRNNPAYSDPAIASQYYDAANQQVQFVVQNRGNLPMAGLGLTIATETSSTLYSVPYLLSGATYVVNLPANLAALPANSSLTFSSQLQLSGGQPDQVPSNNRQSSRFISPRK